MNWEELSTKNRRREDDVVDLREERTAFWILPYLWGARIGEEAMGGNSLR